MNCSLYIPSFFQEVVDQALSVITQVTDQVNSFLQTISNFENELNKHVSGFTLFECRNFNGIIRLLIHYQFDMFLIEADVNGWITAGFDSIVIIPSAIALFAALIAFLAGIFYACQNTVNCLIHFIERIKKFTVSVVFEKRERERER